MASGIQSALGPKHSFIFGDAIPCRTPPTTQRDRRKATVVVMAPERRATLVRGRRGDPLRPDWSRDFDMGMTFTRSGHGPCRLAHEWGVSIRAASKLDLSVRD